MKNIKVDRIGIRLKGISPQLARSTAAGLGNELIEQLGKQSGLLKKKGVINIRNIDTGMFKTSKDTGSSGLRRMIAGRIAESIASRKQN
jgi:hypothetical protein